MFKEKEIKEKKPRLTEKQKTKVREMRAKGMTLQSIGDKYHISRERVRQIVLGEVYNKSRRIEKRTNVLKKLKESKGK